jgi:hypothetical protein
MEIYSIKRLEEMRKGKRGKNRKEYDRIIGEIKKRLPHSCGSEEFYYAPIVHIRCAKCNQPLIINSQKTNPPCQQTINHE